MSNHYASSQETTSERQDYLQYSEKKRRSIHTRYQSLPLMLTNFSFLSISSNPGTRALVPTNIKDFARFLSKKEQQSMQLRRKTKSKKGPVRSLSIFQQNTDRTSNFESNLECLNETDFLKHAPTIEHFNKLNPDASIGIYLKYKKKMTSLSKTYIKRQQSEICLKALKSHLIGIPL